MTSRLLGSRPPSERRACGPGRLSKREPIFFKKRTSVFHSWAFGVVLSVNDKASLLVLDIMKIQNNASVLQSTLQVYSLLCSRPGPWPGPGLSQLVTTSLATGDRGISRCLCFEILEFRTKLCSNYIFFFPLQVSSLTLLPSEYFIHPQVRVLNCRKPESCRLA